MLQYSGNDVIDEGYSTLSVYKFNKGDKALSCFICCSVVIDNGVHFRHHCTNPLGQIDQIFLPYQFITTIFDLFVVGIYEVVCFSTIALYIIREKCFKTFSLSINSMQHMNMDKNIYAGLWPLIRKSPSGVMKNNIYHNKDRCLNLHYQY